VRAVVGTCVTALVGQQVRALLVRLETTYTGVLWLIHYLAYNKDHDHNIGFSPKCTQNHM